LCRTLPDFNWHARVARSLSDSWVSCEEVGGGVETWLMARWKARVEFLLSVIGLLFLSLTVEALQAKCVKTRYLEVWVGHLEPRFQGEGVVPGEYFWFLQN